MTRSIAWLVPVLVIAGFGPGIRTGTVAAAPDWVERAPASHALGVWTPRHAATGGLPSCSAGLHDSYFVVGPDGHRYPTWHPPVVHDPSTGVECAFGHEHGRDPRGSALWHTRQVQRAFYFDANRNGLMDPDEEAWAGLPFGYASARGDEWFEAEGIATMRHEDHVGHKVEWANGEPDIASHAMSRDAGGGVWIGQLGDGVMRRDTGMRCFFLSKVHQGTSTPDAFRHNLHEVMYFQDCRHVSDMAQCAGAGLGSCPDTHPQNAQVSLTLLQPFGRSGGFTAFRPLCGEERRLDPRDFVATGHSAYSRDYPDGLGNREIATRECVERGFLVSPPRFSGNMYEAWPAELSVTEADGRPVAQGLAVLFDVNDAARYYYPEVTKRLRGYDRLHPELAGTDLGYAHDLCSEHLDGRRARYVLCDDSTQAAGGEQVPWDDARAAFRGLNRGTYFKPAVLDNARGPTVWYTSPFGDRAAKTPFPGAIRQQVSARRVDYSTLINGRPIDPRIAQRVHDDGRRSVHAPN